MITAGIDIGSVATKAVILSGHFILATEVMPSGSQPKLTAERALAKSLQTAKMERNQLEYLVSTGYGRRVVDFGDKNITEISACAQGIRFLKAPMGQIMTVIDLGGQDIKVISLDERGEVRDFVMNDKCAAGTGRFMEVIARALELRLEELGTYSKLSKKRIDINATCTVFAESEVVSLLAQDVGKEDIIAGIHRSIAERIATMGKKIGLKEVVAFTGGGAKNKGFCQILEEELGLTLHIPKIPQFVNALGAAVAAKAKK
ncbi:2-hydroxyglutaryl-CoA dehydratase [candidate division FCPU426 bacterium]|nr:2-hydroxyglutaryl-CoA dehydratase [candidate division FCPU426 bacterium]